MSIAAYADMIIDQNADFAVQMYWTDYNNLPYSVVSPMRMEIRASTGDLVTELVYRSNPLAGEEQTILFNVDSGLIQLQLSAEKTNKIPPGEYNYDLFVTYQDKLSTNSTRRTKLLFGKVIVRGKVTQSV